MDDQTVVLIYEPDGSWIIQGIGQRDVRLSRDVMWVVAQKVLRRRRAGVSSPRQPDHVALHGLSRGDEHGDRWCSVQKRGVT